MRSVARDDVDVAHAVASLSSLLDRVERGEEIVISRDGSPVAVLRPPPPLPMLGWAAGDFVVPEDFDAPLQDQDMWGGIES